MFKKILLCTDLSPASESLVGCIEEMKKVRLEEVVLTHVIYVANTPGLEVMLEEEARPILERQKSTLESNGFRVTIESPFGLPAHTLAELAEKHNVSLVVVGSHGRGIMAGALLGSVSSKLLHLTRRPVLVIRLTVLEGERCGLACGKLFQRILYPTDFSETAEHALGYLGEIAAETKSPVTLLHVYDEKTLDAESRRRLEDGRRFFSDAKVERLKSRGVSEVNVDLIFGDPAEEIIAKANKEDFSLIVMGNKGKGFIQEVVHGSIANKVVRNAPVPVLLIPAISD